MPKRVTGIGAHRGLGNGEPRECLTYDKGQRGKTKSGTSGLARTLSERPLPVSDDTELSAGKLPFDVLR